jgi:hypothetical protein
MPTAKIHVHEHRYDEQRLAKLGDAIQGALQASNLCAYINRLYGIGGGVPVRC